MVTHDGHIAEKYIVPAAYISRGIEQILSGEIPEIPPAMIPSALGMLRGAHCLFEKVQFGFPPLQTNSRIIGLRPSLNEHATITIASTYKEATEEEVNSFEEIERVIRDLAYWTEGLPHITHVSPEVRPPLEMLYKFYKKLEQKGNAARTSRIHSRM